jgi:hypothetical protein
MAPRGDDDDRDHAARRVHAMVTLAGKDYRRFHSRALLAVVSVTVGDAIDE